MFIVDTNILVYAHNESSERHTKAYEFVQEKVQTGRMCLSHQILKELYRVLTQKLQYPLSPRSAWDIINHYLQNPSVTILIPVSTTFSLLQDLCLRYNIRGSHVFDANIVSLMLDNNINTIYTENVKHFKVFREIQVINPLSS